MNKSIYLPEYLNEYHIKSQLRHNTPVIRYEDWQKTMPIFEKRDRPLNDDLNIDAINDIKQKSDKEIVEYTIKWMKKHMKTPLEDYFENRWLGVLKNVNEIYNEDCVGIATQFKNMDSETILKNFRGKKEDIKQNGTTDGWEISWREKWSYTDDDDEFIDHHNKKLNHPIMRIGGDAARRKLLTKLGIIYKLEGKDKNPDVLISKSGWVIFGERKNMANQGGTQDTAVADAIRYPKITDVSKGIIGLSIMIGSYWDIHDEKIGCPGVIHTALLEDFINGLPLYEEVTLPVNEVKLELQPS